MSSENFKIQIRKGLLEFCVLQIISSKEVYASEIIEELKNSKIIVVEGTVYPLLSRLKKSNYIQHSWKESTQGPPRKYYSITGPILIAQLKNYLRQKNEKNIYNKPWAFNF